MIIPENGYKLTGNTQVNINGSSELFAPEFSNVADGHIETIDMYVEREVVGSVVIELTEPEFGTAPDANRDRKNRLPDGFSAPLS